VTELKDFNYSRLTPTQLAKLVYDLNHALVDEMRKSQSSDVLNRDISERAQKIINRARLEGIL